MVWECCTSSGESHKYENVHIIYYIFIYLYIYIRANVAECATKCSSQTWRAHRIFGCITRCLYRAGGTFVVISACRTVVIFGIELAARASLAFRRITSAFGDEFLARRALGDYHETAQQ